MIQITDKKDCCGCSACSQKCPVQAITMKEDLEGFLYPVVETAKCIHCGICEKVCPILNKVEELPFEQDAYVAQLQDRALLANSTSGGTFSAIAAYVLNKGGVVFGAAFDEDFTVSHCKIESISKLNKLRGSKYVQSKIGSCYVQAKEELKKGKLVLFSGTPCQIEGLLNFVEGTQENLITVDVVCRAVPSPYILKKYIEYRKRKFASNITGFKFRDKRPYGYQMSALSAYSNKKQIYHGDISIDPYLRAFFSNICDRPSCYNCAFKKRYRRSDITLWDCLNISEFCEPTADMKPNLGLNSVLFHSAKGRKIWKEIQHELLYCKVNADILTGAAKEMTKSVPLNDLRDKFLEDANNLSPEDLFQKYFPKRAKNRVEHFVRTVLARFGITSKVRLFAKKFIKNYKR